MEITLRAQENTKIWFFSSSLCIIHEWQRLVWSSEATSFPLIPANVLSKTKLLLVKLEYNLGNNWE